MFIYNLTDELISVDGDNAELRRVLNQNIFNHFEETNIVQLFNNLLDIVLGNLTGTKPVKMVNDFDFDPNN